MTHLDHLRTQHRNLDLKIAAIQSRKAELLSDNDLAVLHKLKKQKLALKDKIADLESEKIVETEFVI